VINKKGLRLVKDFEGLYTKAYYCPAGVLTIGYGHTGADVKRGMIITEKQAEKILENDLASVSSRVQPLIKAKVNSNQLSAIISFTFNCGVGALSRSTLLKKLNSCDYEGAADEFLKWNKATVNGVKKVLAGLTRRRKAERDLFLMPEEEIDPVKHNIYSDIEQLITRIETDQKRNSETLKLAKSIRLKLS